MGRAQEVEGSLRDVLGRASNVPRIVVVGPTSAPARPASQLVDGALRSTTLAVGREYVSTQGWPIAFQADGLSPYERRLHRIRPQTVCRNQMSEVEQGSFHLIRVSHESGLCRNTASWTSPRSWCGRGPRGPASRPRRQAWLVTGCCSPGSGTWRPGSGSPTPRSDSSVRVAACGAIRRKWAERRRAHRGRP